MSDDHVTLRLSREDYEMILDACACERARRTQELAHWVGREDTPRFRSLKADRDELAACIQRLKEAGR